MGPRPPKQSETSPHAKSEAKPEDRYPEWSRLMAAAQDGDKGAYEHCFAT
jgi:hypothetical protein